MICYGFNFTSFVLLLALIFNSFQDIPKCRIFGIDRSDADSSSLHARKGPLAPEFSNSIFLD